MQQQTYKSEYAVISPDGQNGERYPLQSRFKHLSGVINLAAEDYHKRPEAAGAVCPLRFAAFTPAGVEMGRCTVKCWMVPHFMITNWTRS